MSVKPVCTARSRAVIVTVPAPEKSSGNAFPFEIFIAPAKGCPEVKKKTLSVESQICFAADQFEHKSKA